MIQTFLFYCYAALAVIGAIGLVRAHKLLHSVAWTLLALSAVAGLYFSLGSEFLGAMQLFVYGGAVTILTLFVVMLTRQGAQEQEKEDSSASAPASARVPVKRLAALVISLVLFCVLTIVFVSTPWETVVPSPQTSASLAEILFSRYMLPFEIVGLALTIALIGAIVLAREDDPGDSADATDGVAGTDDGGTADGTVAADTDDDPGDAAEEGNAL
ncbi:MAG: NADH-quinone oxidoreductase subunit J [Coriobacteriia bacterium]|nr:NADH-quinone oxidoreductase subunit J [Coriobacteriia bacterium]